MWTEISRRRAVNMRAFVHDLELTGQLRRDLDPDEAADMVWATNSTELYVLLTTERSWTPQHYRDGLTDTWQRLLLDPRHRA